MANEKVWTQAQREAVITDHYFDTMGLDMTACAECGRPETDHLKRPTAKPSAPASGNGFEEGASLIEIVCPTATELWESLESFLNSLHKGACGEESPEGLDHAQFVVMALRPMIAALSSKPEGESRVTWRVDQEGRSGHWFPVMYESLHETKDSALEVLERRSKNLSVRLVKIETTETIIEVRKKEK